MGSYSASAQHLVDEMRAMALAEPARRPVKSAVANIEYRLGVREERLPEIDAWLKKQGG